MSAPPTLAIQPLHPDACMPSYQSEGAAGLDLHARLDGPVTIAPGDIELISIGISIALPAGHEGQVRPRSGLASRHGITMPNAPGTIDEDYRGEIKVPLINHGREPFTIEPGMRIAQLVVAPVTHCAIVEASDLSVTARGDGGFGSTGT